MATYTINTNRKREAGLKFSYDNYADKTKYPTQESYLQSRVNIQVTDPMYAESEAAQSISFDQSFDTIPELSQPPARTDIEGVITSYGGTIIQPGPIHPPPTPLPPSDVGGAVFSPRGTPSNPIQIGGTTKEKPDGNVDNVEPSRRDGFGDYKTPG